MFVSALIVVFFDLQRIRKPALNSTVRESLRNNNMKTRPFGR